MKRSFLLLEVLIAIALLTLVAAFLFYHPISFIKKEKAQLEEIAKERLYLQTIEEIRLALFKNELPFTFNEKNKTLRQLKKPGLITIEGFKNLAVKRYYYLWFDPEKAALGDYGQSFNLMHLEVSFTPPLPGKKNFSSDHPHQTRHAIFFVQKMPGTDKNTDQDNPLALKN